MEITGKVHCFFEQSGTFKNEFIKLGIPAEDYDIQNNFGETDHVVDLFQAIEDAYDGKPSLFDNIRGGDLVLAFFRVSIFLACRRWLCHGLAQITELYLLSKLPKKYSNVLRIEKDSLGLRSRCYQQQKKEDCV